MNGKVARRLKRYSRKSDPFVRYGGEKFLLLLPGPMRKKLWKSRIVCTRPCWNSLSRKWVP
ncbi:MAG: diguanylate cyclase [Nitrospirae bacterium]|nr:diguanylate cyclase [Magnetococcales bacterium]